MNIVLQSKITGTVETLPYRNALRAVLRTAPKPTIAIEQHRKGEWRMTSGRWYLSTLAETPVTDAIYIDYGTQWLAHGMLDVVREATQKLSEIDSEIDNSSEN